MEEGYNEAIKRLKKYNQEHIISILENIEEPKKENLENQILNLDFENITGLYEELTKKKDINIDNIEPIKAIKKESLEKEKLDEYIKQGENIIKSNKFALATMSGGQGTRLGFNGPKGTFKVNINPRPKYLFEILADSLIEANNKYRCNIPWYIMTSEENNDDIINFFEENNYFNYDKTNIKFFSQSNLPLLSQEGKLLIDEDFNIKQAADGNGGIFNSMYKNGIIKDIEEKDIKWVFIGSIDNILLKIADPLLIGIAENTGVDIATKSIPKNSPNEKVGAICKQNGKVKVIEYSEMPQELAELKDENDEFIYGESHIMCNLFSRNALNKLSNEKLPYHIAFKKYNFIDEKGNFIVAENPNAYKFESFIFDSFTYFDDIAVLRGKREADFAPIKNKEGIDSPKTAIELYNNYIQKEEKGCQF